LKQSINQWEKEWNDGNEAEVLNGRDPQKTASRVQFYLIEIGFDQIKDEAERTYFETLPTTFHLPPEAVKRLRAVATKLLTESEGYRKLLRDLDREMNGLTTADLNNQLTPQQDR
jgi:NTE family protein